MKPSEIKAHLQQLGGRANKKLGQHFLVDPSVLQTIVTAADIHSGDRVLEIGPGLGVLTQALVEKGAEVVAIEQDRRFVPLLEKISNVKIVHGDAADIHWHTLVQTNPWKFVSNLPYSITSLALRKALWNPHPPERIIVLVQREVAERAIAREGKSSLLSLMVALASSSARIIKRVPPGAFYPPPKVESAVLEIIPLSWAERQERWKVDPEKIMLLAKKGFAHPRKFLTSNLGLTADQLAAFSGLGLSSKIRAEDLSPADWASLTRLL